MFQALGPHLKTGNLGNVLCGSSYKVPSLEDLTKLAQKVIVTEQLEDHIRATVDTATANYAIVSLLQDDVVIVKTIFSTTSYAIIVQVLRHFVVV